MDIHFEHRCDTCGIEFRTEGFMEFYRDEEGAVRVAGDAAAAAGHAIVGTCCNAWCRTCCANVLAVESELAQPVEAGPQSWAELGWAKRHDPACPECGGTDLVVGEPTACPICGGRIEVVHEGIG